MPGHVAKIMVGIRVDHAARLNRMACLKGVEVMDRHALATVLIEEGLADVTVLADSEIDVHLLLECLPYHVADCFIRVERAGTRKEVKHVRLLQILFNYIFIQFDVEITND